MKNNFLSAFFAWEQKRISGKKIGLKKVFVQQFFKSGMNNFYVVNCIAAVSTGCVTHLYVP
jgi:hypothetical protein